MAEPTNCGTIKSVNPDKGYGWISRGDGRRDVFFQVTDLDGSLNFYESLIDTPVIFDVVEAQSGPKAVNVKRAQ